MLQFDIEQKNRMIMIHVCGELNLENINNVERAWFEQLGKNPKVIAINCKYLRKIDSSAIGALVKLFNASKRNRVELLLVDLDDSIQTFFVKAKLERFFNITTMDNLRMLESPTV